MPASSKSTSEASTTVHRHIHVSPTGDNKASGSIDAPLQTICAAADQAQPGDTIIIHSGIYREEINPPRGGISDRTRITYTAADNESVDIRGSEVVEQWTHVDGDIWTAQVSNRLFGDFNPYSDLIRGDWFCNEGRDHHTGAVYINNAWLTEAANRDALSRSEQTAGHWFAQVGHTHTTFWANFNGAAPNKAVIEINVRQTVFYPRVTGINFMTIRGLNLRHAATNWAPPTAEQVALIGTNWSKGWIIENNTITHSRCSGISLGKYGDEFDNTSAGLAVGYDQTIARALTHNWDQDHIGSHIVRNNTISHCEQAGIVGSLGAIFSQITGNTVHDIHVQQLFSGEEQAGIKIHAPIDTLIAGNHVYRTYRGIWMDWMTQGTRVSNNLCHDNDIEDMHLEVNHGPYVVDHNILLSQRSIKNWSQGGAFFNNLFGGKLFGQAVTGRSTPYHLAHSTTLAGESNITGGDDRFFNNLVVDHVGLEAHIAKDRPCDPTQARGDELEVEAMPSFMAGNEHLPTCPQLLESKGAFYLQLDEAPSEDARALPSTTCKKELGIAKITQVPFEAITRQDFEQAMRYVGPWQRQASSPTLVQVWPR